MKKLFLITNFTILSSILFAQANTMDVKGSAVVEEKPGLVNLTITVEEKSLSYTDCQEQLLRTIEKEKEIFNKYQIDTNLFRISQLSVSDDDVFKNGGMVKLGYKGSANVTVENDYTFDFLNKLLAALKSDSLPVTYAIYFTLSEKQKDDLRQNSIKLAIADAKEKAITIADASGIKILGIKHIQYSDELNYGGSDMLIRRRDLTGAVNISNNMDFNPQPISIERAVLITWTIADKTIKK